MSAARIARAGRIRFIVGFVLLFLMAGFVMMFHSSQQELDELRQLGIRCKQEQDSMGAQMQVVVDHKFRLEKSMAAEQNFNKQLQHKAKEEKELRDKSVLESNLRFSSLQQHYKLLKSEHDDLKESCSKEKQSQMVEINGMLGKIKSLQALLVQAEQERKKEIENWKIKNKQLETEKMAIEKSAASSKSPATVKVDINLLQKTLDEYKRNCEYRPYSRVDYHNSMRSSHSRPTRIVEKNFDGQIAVSDDLYRIPIHISNNNRSPTSNNRMQTTNLSSGGGGGGGNNVSVGLVDVSPNPDDGVELSKGQVINSVENFQIIPEPFKELIAAADRGNVDNKDNPNDANVLQQPPGFGPKSSSTPTNDRRTSETAERMGAPIAVIPTVIVAKKSTPSTSLAKHRPKPLPAGVVPVPQNMNDLIKANENNSAEPNRYSSLKIGVATDHEPAIPAGDVGAESVGAEPAIRDEEVAPKKSELSFSNMNEIDEGAREVNDNNDFNIDEKNNHRDHLQEVLNDEKLNGNQMNANGNHNSVNANNNNAAEEDTNLYDHKMPLNLQKANNDLDLQIINSRVNPRGAANDKLMNEIAGDQGKVAADYPDDMREDIQLEEQPDEEDDDEYANPANRQEPAVRN